ncbi:MAG: hypothetical protein E7387_07375 [Ruminococcaceae bacterium]|nr:hypothetical protein [Oscillospiraceae bacterium]
MDKKFFIGAFYGPTAPMQINDVELGVVHTTKDFATDEYYKMIADLGIRTITYIENDYNKNPKGVIRDLELAEKYGIELYILDTGITGDMTKEQLNERIAAYKNYSSFAGIHVIDEPTTDDYMKHKINRRIQKYYSVMQLLANNGIKAYMNMLPYLHFMGSKSAYRKMYDKYIEFCKTPLISFDRYVFDGGYQFKDWPIRSFFTNLEIAKEYSLKAGIPFCPFVQAGSQWNDEQKHFKSEPYYPTERQIFWQINCCILWGAKGIQYFPLIQPLWFAYGEGSDMDYGRNGIIGANGVPTMWYSAVKRSVSWIKKVENILIDCEPIEVLAKGRYPEKYSGNHNQNDDIISNITISDENYGTFIGAFNYKNDKRVYVVLNANHNAAAKIKIDLKKVYLTTTITENTSRVKEMTDTKEFELTAGEAAMIIVG